MPEIINCKMSGLSILLYLAIDIWMWEILILVINLLISRMMEHNSFMLRNLQVQMIAEPLSCWVKGQPSHHMHNLEHWMNWSHRPSKKNTPNYTMTGSVCSFGNTASQDGHATHPAVAKTIRQETMASSSIAVRTTNLPHCSIPLRAIT